MNSEVNATAALAVMRDIHKQSGGHQWTATSLTQDSTQLRKEVHVHGARYTHCGISPPKSYAQQRAVPVILQILWSDDLMVTTREGEERGIMRDDKKIDQKAD